MVMLELELQPLLVFPYSLYIKKICTVACNSVLCIDSSFGLQITPLCVTLWFQKGHWFFTL